MNKIIGLGIAAAALVWGASAQAADLPARMATKAPPYIAQVYNWTGFYAGIHGGYGWADLDADGAGTIDQNGGLIGGQIGFNWQAPGSPWVWGLELDSAWADISDSATDPLFGTAESSVNYLGSLRGRIGYAWDRTLLYATGGLGWAHNEITATGLGPIPAFSVSNTHFGFAVGGGLEYAFAGPWSAKVEYVYYGLGSESYAGIDADLNIHTIKGGINYRFGAF